VVRQHQCENLIGLLANRNVRYHLRRRGIDSRNRICGREWETLPEIVSLAGGAAHHSANMIADLEVDSRRMRHNLEATNGLIYAEAVAFKLAEKIGKPAAHELLQSASRRALECRKHLAEVIALDPRVTQHFPADELKGFFDPQQYLGSAQLFIDAVLNSYTVRPQRHAVH